MDAVRLTGSETYDLGGPQARVSQSQFPSGCNTNHILIYFKVSTTGTLKVIYLMVILEQIVSYNVFIIRVFLLVFSHSIDRNSRCLPLKTRRRG